MTASQGYHLSGMMVSGFKSFAEMTNLTFDPGVSVLVGGNGSGKSNLVDALRWVFGESDLSSLRAQAPSELCFAGTDDLPAAAGAGVTVLLNRSTGGPNLLIARTVDADGRGRHLVNGREVAPDDIGGVLREHGVAAPLRTVVRQGDVGRLLWLHPQERATLFAAALEHERDETGRDLEEAFERDLAHAQTAVVHLAQELDQLEGEVARWRSLNESAVAAHTLDVQIADARAALLASVMGRSQVLDGVLNALGLPGAGGMTLDDAAVQEGSQTTVEADATPAEVASHLRNLLERRSGLPAEAALADARLAESEAALALATAMLDRARRDTDLVRSQHEQTVAARRQAFLALHARIEKRFIDFFEILAPGGEAELPLAGDSASLLPGVAVSLRFPSKPRVPLEGLSGGQLVIGGLSLALAYFLEVPSPLLVLDEVEPALDEFMVRRVAQLLMRLAEERQVVMVSHQRPTRDMAKTVFQVHRTPARGSHIRIRYDPGALRGPSAPTPTTQG